MNKRRTAGGAAVLGWLLIYSCVSVAGGSHHVDLASAIGPAPADLGEPVLYQQGISPDSVMTEKGFGTQDFLIANLPFTSFAPSTSSGGFIQSCCGGSDGSSWPTASNRFLVASLDEGHVPNGADLSQLAFYFTDNTALADENLRGYLCRSWVDSDGTDPGASCMVIGDSFSGPGDTVFTADPNVPVIYRYDIDNDGTTEVVSYTIYAEFGINGTSVFSGDIRLRQVRVLYQRQIRPAPATATFSDVSTGHVFFQHIEALADSGITAGCGGGNYCPDAPLTRGQMAVFLAKALGLHWPAFGVGTLP